METQGEILVSVTSRMHRAEEEVKNLKRSASREDPIPEVKKFCVDEAVKQIVRLNEERKLSAKREASKQTVTSQERIRRGLAPAGEPKGAMLNKGLDPARVRTTGHLSTMTGWWIFSLNVSSWIMRC